MGGITYDTTPKTVTIKVTDNGAGQLVVDTANSTLTVTANNTYRASGTLDLTALKVLEAGDRALKAGEFSFQLKDAEGNVLQTKANAADGTVTFDTITYTLDDVANSPIQYTISEVKDSDATIMYDETVHTITVTLKDDGAGKIIATPDKTGAAVKFTNKTTSVKVKKVDVADGEELEGAKIQIIDSEGKVVEEWTSTKEAHEVTGLKMGETYTLHEEVAPEGYTITADTSFTIDATGKVTSTDTTIKDGVLLVEDSKTSVKVKKVDVADGEELEGATIQIIDSEGNVVEEWTSTEEAHEIEGLKTGEEYTLRETVAPEGYTVTTDTKFTIDETGKVTSTGSVTEEGVLLVEDAKTSVKVKKVDIADGKELEGATIQIIDKNGKVVDEWTSTKEAHETKGLKTGEEYTLRETVAPEGYDVTTDITFTIDEHGKVTTTGNTTTDASGDTVILVEDAAKKQTEYTDITGRKIWVDNDNEHGVRPEKIEVKLFADGTEVQAKPTWTVIDDNTWEFTFTKLPLRNSEDKPIRYTVTETPVEYYTTSISGMTITNTVEDKGPKEFVTVSGTKTWVDNDNADGKRPASILVKLLRDGEVIDQKTVTEADGWSYSFGELPADDGFTVKYTYTIQEAPVAGYYTRIKGYDITNTRLPDKTKKKEKKKPTKSKPKYGKRTEEEMEELIDLFDYMTPLWGGLLGTGDETPVYPYVFGGVGLAALLAVLLGRKRKKTNR